MSKFEDNPLKITKFYFYVNCPKTNCSTQIRKAGHLATNSPNTPGLTEMPNLGSVNRGLSYATQLRENN